MRSQARRYKKPPEKVQEAIARAVLPLLTQPDMPVETRGPYGKSTLIRSGLVDTLCRLKFLGYSNYRAAQTLKVSHDVVDSFVKTSEYEATYTLKRELFLNSVGDTMRELVLEVLGECIVGKVDDMRDKRTRAPLRNQIRNELIELGRDLLKGRATGGADAALKAMYEKAIKRKAADGSEITETYRITGEPVAGAPPGWPTEPAAGSETPAAVDRPGAASGGERPAAPEGDAGGAGSDSGDGAGGIRAEPGGTTSASEPVDEVTGGKEG